MPRADVPLVSIVMPSLNQGQYLPLAVESILSQRYPKLEIVVADGGSNDDSIPWLTERAKQDGRLRFISQKDSGPAQAINRALDLARGTIIGWLNSDDLYTPGCITRAVDAFQSNPYWMMLYGQGEHIDANGFSIDAYPTLPPDQDALHRFEDGCFICQPTVFFQSTMKLLLGKLDEQFKTAFDFDYWVRAFQAFPGRVGFVKAVQAQTRLHDACITLTQRRFVYVESMNIISRYLSDPPSHWLLSYANERRANDPALNSDEIRADLYKIIDELDPKPTEHGFKRLRWFVKNYSC